MWFKRKGCAMRKSSAELRRAIQFERKEAEEYIDGIDLEYSIAKARIDLLRWMAGEPGTSYEQLMRHRNKDDLGKMPAASGRRL